jgi:hypothetical protein
LCNLEYVEKPEKIDAQTARNIHTLEEQLGYELTGSYPYFKFVSKIKYYSKKK